MWQYHEKRPVDRIGGIVKRVVYRQIFRKKVITKCLQHFAANRNCILSHTSDAVIDVLVLSY